MVISVEFYIKPVAAKRVAATFMAAHTLPENPVSRHSRLEQKVALCAANNASVATFFRLSLPIFLSCQIVLHSA